MRKLLSLILLSILFVFPTLSQNGAWQFVIKGQVIVKKQPCPNAKVTITADGIVVAEKKTDKNGVFEFYELPFQKLYKVNFVYRNCIPQFYTVDAHIDKNPIKKDYGTDIQLELWDTTVNKSVDFRKFRYPCMKWFYNKQKDEMNEDKKYKEDFINNVIAEMEEDLKKEALLAQELEKQKKEERIKKRKEAIENAKKNIRFMGNLLFADKRTKAIANKKVSLVNSKGEVVETTTTNAFGTFVFTTLPTGESFTVRVDETDTQLAATGKYIITNRDGKEINSVANAGGKALNFSFAKGDNTTLSLMTLDANKNTIDIKGKIGNADDGKNTPLAGVTVLIKDPKGITAQTTTDANGQFVFSMLPADQNYSVMLDEKDAKLATINKVNLMDANGTKLKELNKADGFKFEFLARDNSSLELMQAQDTELKTDIKGKIINEANKAPVTGVKVNLTNQNNEVVASTKTDANGAFTFDYLPSGELYNIAIDPGDDPKLTAIKMVITNEKGNFTKQGQKENNIIRFELLPVDQNQLSYIYMDDPWLKLVDPKRKAEVPASTVMLFKENIYFKAGDAVLLPDAQRLLDKIIDILSVIPNINVDISAHTDSKGSDQNNLLLSEKRAQSAVEYMIKSGIDKTRIKGKGYGETKLINKCGNNVNCSEEEHAKNRRIEFSVTVK